MNKIYYLNKLFPNIMSVSYFIQKDISVTSDLQPVLSNPFPDGQFSFFFQAGDQNLVDATIVLDQGNALYSVTTGNMSYDEFGNSTIYLPPDYLTSTITFNYAYSGPSNNGFYVSASIPTVMDLHGKLVPLGFTGTLQSTNSYTSTGPISNLVSWYGSTAVNTGGSFFVDISSANFQTITSVQNTVVNATFPTSVTLSSVTNSTITGNVTGYTGGCLVYTNVVGN